jgi:hypothetical protein
MNKEDYKAALKQIDEESLQLSKRRNEAREAFLKANAQFKVGDRVIVVYNETALFGRVQPEKRIECFISDIHDKYSSGNVYYEFNKVKKDGTMSNQSAGIYGGYSRIELKNPEECDASKADSSNQS